MDVGQRIGKGRVGELLDRCVARGLLIAPGSAFGPYPDSVRLCYTTAPPEVVLRGVQLLAEIIEDMSV